MSGKSDYLENKFLDFLLRGQALTAPANVFVALFTAAPSDAGGGTEVSGGNYARVSVASSLANWAGTQSAGSSAISTGTGGTTSNNAAITFPAPNALWGLCTHFGIYDAASAGNLLYWGPLTIPQTIGNGNSAPSFAVGTLSIVED